MIVLTQNQQKYIALTLKELASESLPSNWLFVFELLQNDGYIYKKQLVDVSDYPESYNRFSITPGTDIEFEIEGDYRYLVYQMPDDTSTDETEGQLVEQGLMRLKLTEEEIPTFTVNTDAKIHKVSTEA